MLLDFFFDTKCYAILMSNSFTLVHFCKLAQPLQCLLFCFSLKTNLYNDLFLRTRLWKHRQQSIVSWRTASPHCSMQRLWLDVSSQIDRQFTCENFHAKKNIIVHTNNSQNNSSLSLLSHFLCGVLPSVNQKNWINSVLLEVIIWQPYRWQRAKITLGSRLKPAYEREEPGEQACLFWSSKPSTWRLSEPRQETLKRRQKGMFK